MQPVAVLADEICHQTPVLQLDEGHVGGCRDGLQCVHCRRGPLSALGLERPCALGAPEIRDAGRRRDARPRKHDEVLALPDEVGELAGFLVQVDRSLNQLGQRRGPGHVGLCRFVVFI